MGQSDPAAFYAADRAFHDGLYAALRNRFLEDSTRALRNRVGPYRRHVTYQPGRMLDSVREHGQVLDAVRRNDGDAAHAAMRAHVTLLGESFADFISSYPHMLATQARRIA